MTLLKVRGYERRTAQPPVYDVGCSGVITHVERLADGRFNLILRGVEKFQIVGEEEPAPGQLYRTAHVISPLDEERRTTSNAPGWPRSGASSKSGWRPSSSGPAPSRSCRRRWRTRTWSTRWRSTWSSSRSSVRRCSNSRAGWPAAGR